MASNSGAIELMDRKHIKIRTIEPITALTAYLRKKADLFPVSCSRHSFVQVWSKVVNQIVFFGLSL